MQIPRTCQCLLMSATTSEDVQRLQQLVLHNPTVIDCTNNGSEANDMAGSNAAGTSSQIQHFSIQCDRSAPTAGHHFSGVSTFRVNFCSSSSLLHLWSAVLEHHTASSRVSKCTFASHLQVSGYALKLC